MRYKTTRPIMVLSSGFQREADKPIGPGEIEPDVFNAMLANGSIVDLEAPVKMVAKAPAKPRRKKAVSK